ncbi:MAG: 4Fe-4S dicluster domain-containing protein [Dehalococcoidia bacterium]|nr:4Fe-4S dicluster domain-containing protein [Dehalococcoidia bacterium]
MDYRLKYRDILYNDEQLGPYPDHKLKRVDKPTNRIFGEIKRRDTRENALFLTHRGDYGPEVQREAPRMTVREPLGAAFMDVQHHINTIKKNSVTPVKAPLPENSRVVSRHIKSLGYFLGADLMGICELPQSAVYTHDVMGNPIEVQYKYAVVFACSKSMRTVNASNGYDWIFDPVSFQAYQRLACQTETMASYIRRLGYEAEASNTFNFLTLMPQLVLMAGLGEVSRVGIILNPFLGLNYKTSAVLTDLPMEIDKPIDFGLQEYCRNCTICADQCPVKAIPYGDKVQYNGYETWKMDERKCASFAVLNKYGNICGRCTKVCPWNRPNSTPRDFESWDGSIESLYLGVDRQAEKIKRDGFIHETERTRKWWFDFEEIGNAFVIPKTTKEHFLER